LKENTQVENPFLFVDAYVVMSICLAWLDLKFDYDFTASLLAFGINGSFKDQGRKFACVIWQGFE